MRCVKCGRSLEQAMKIYPHGLEGGAYCYDCGSAEKRACILLALFDYSVCVIETVCPLDLGYIEAFASEK